MNERVGTAQRQAAVELLTRALEGGYIDLVEYERRMVVVQSATFAGDIVGPMSDLPRQFQWNPHHEVAPVVPPAQQHHQQVPAADVGSKSTLSLVMGALSLPLSICFGIGLIPAVAALLLSRPGLKAHPTNTSAVVGLVLGIVGVAASVVMLIAFIGSIVDPPSTT